MMKKEDVLELIDLSKLTNLLNGVKEKRSSSKRRSASTGRR